MPELGQDEERRRRGEEWSRERRRGENKREEERTKRSGEAERSGAGRGEARRRRTRCNMMSCSARFCDLRDNVRAAAVCGEGFEGFLCGSCAAGFEKIDGDCITRQLTFKRQAGVQQSHGLVATQPPPAYGRRFVNCVDRQFKTHICRTITIVAVRSMSPQLYAPLSSPPPPTLCVPSM